MAKSKKTKQQQTPKAPEPYIFADEQFVDTRPDVLLHDPVKGSDYPPAITIRRYKTNHHNERKMIEEKVFDLVERVVTPSEDDKDIATA